MDLNLFTLPSFFAFLLNVVLAILALQQAPRHRLHRLFAAWNGTVAAWNLATFIMHTAPDAATAVRDSLWIRDVFLFIYPVFLHLVLEFTRDRRPFALGILRAAYLTSAAFVISNHIPGWMVKGMQHYYWGYYPLAGPAAFLYTICFFGTIGYALTLLARASKEETGYRRSQSRILLIATVMVFLSTISNFLVAFGASIYPFGSLFNILFSLMIAYAVITYGLMDIEIALRKGAAYASLATAMMATYVLIEFLIKRMFLEHDTRSAAYAFHLAAVPMTLALVPRMRSAIDPAIRRMPFWRSHDREKIMREMGQALLSMLNMEELGKRVVTQLSDIFNVERVILYMSRGEGVDFEQRAASLPAEEPLDVDTGAISHLLKTGAPTHLERLLWEKDNRGLSDERQALADFMVRTNLYVLVPLTFRGRPEAILALGPKRTQEMYNAEDFALMDSLKPQLVLALSNASRIEMLEEQQRQHERQRETNFMGTLATEIAHELTKPLTRILNEESRLTTALNEQSHPGLRKIGREALRAAEIVEGFAMLSTHRPLERQLLSLDQLIEEAIAMLQIATDRNCVVLKKLEPCPLAVNRGQILQVLTNLLQNAWEAMPEGGTLLVRVSRAGAEAVVEISDTGAGIPKENQEKIFEPFFTTKQGAGGRGVGLTISRAMVERHGGTIRIQSPLGPEGGTRVVVRLPSSPEEESDAE